VIVKLTSANYRDIAEYLAIAQSDLMATSFHAAKRHPGSSLPALLVEHAKRAGKLRATILHALIAAGESGS
jgi:hypothetical protein